MEPGVSQYRVNVPRRWHPLVTMATVVVGVGSWGTTKEQVREKFVRYFLN